GAVGEGRRTEVGDRRVRLVDLEGGARDTGRGVAGEIGAAVGGDGQGAALTARRLGLRVAREGEEAGRVGARDVGVQAEAVRDVGLVPAVAIGEGRRTAIADDRRGLVDLDQAEAACGSRVPRVVGA